MTDLRWKVVRTASYGPRTMVFGHLLHHTDKGYQYVGDQHPDHSLTHGDVVSVVDGTTIRVME